MGSADSESARVMTNIAALELPGLSRALVATRCCPFWAASGGPDTTKRVRVGRIRCSCSRVPGSPGPAHRNQWCPPPE